MTIYDVLGKCLLFINTTHIPKPLIPKKPKNNIIKNFQTYYPKHSPQIKISNFKTIQLCPKIVIDQHTPLNNFNFQSNYYPLWAKQLFITNAYIG